MKTLISAMTLTLLGGMSTATVWADAPTPEPAEEKADGLVTPEAGSPEHVVLQGLKLIESGKFDRWVKRYCHAGKLCVTPMAIKSLKAFNLKAVQKLAPHCIRGKGKDQLHITRREQVGSELKLYIRCRADGMPRPFTLEREANAWKFRRI